MSRFSVIGLFAILVGLIQGCLVEQKETTATKWDPKKVSKNKPITAVLYPEIFNFSLISKKTDETFEVPLAFNYPANFICKLGIEPLASIEMCPTEQGESEKESLTFDGIGSLTGAVEINGKNRYYFRSVQYIGDDGTYYGFLCGSDDKLVGIGVKKVGYEPTIAPIDEPIVSAGGYIRNERERVRRICGFTKTSSTMTPVKR